MRPAAPGDDRIWGHGLRNPWRFAFDPPGGTLYIADVGQNDREEVNAVPDGRAGVNYGWNVMEGTSCIEPSRGRDPDGLTLPVLDYPHEDGACSATSLGTGGDGELYLLVRDGTVFRLARGG